MSVIVCPVSSIRCNVPPEDYNKISGLKAFLSLKFVTELTNVALCPKFYNINRPTLLYIDSDKTEVSFSETHVFYNVNNGLVFSHSLGHREWCFPVTKEKSRLLAKTHDRIQLVFGIYSKVTCLTYWPRISNLSSNGCLQSNCSHYATHLGLVPK